MKQFLILSAQSRDQATALVRAAERFGEREQWPAAQALTLGPAELVVWGADDDDVLDAAASEAAIITGLARFDARGGRLTPRAVLDCVKRSGPGAVEEIAPPQSVVVATADPALVIAATDHTALAAVYAASRRGATLAGSSSRLLAALLDLPLDARALAALAALGEFPSTDTPFTGVRRLAGGEYVRFTGDRADTASYRTPFSTQAPEDPVRDGARVVRAAVETCLSAYPEATLELSGGLDSRLMLAGIVATGQLPTEFMTMGEPGHPDVLVAADLAARYAVPHERVDTADMDGLEPQAALALVDRAGRRRDYSGNCVALGVLDWVEPKAGSRPRFSGQNGELARGFYYPLQPRWPRTSPALANALVRWRLMANERASGELYIPALNAAGEQRARTTTIDLLERSGRDWLSATDVLYLDWRMQRWVGTDWSAAMQTRPILAPFFQRPYLEWALNAPPERKRGSALLAQVLDAIDPELARLPLAGGGSPYALFDPRVRDRVEQARTTGDKVVRKLRQRFGETSYKAPVGAPLLAQKALEALADERTGLEAVARLPFVSSEYVERVLETRDASPTTVGVLVALRGLAGS